MVHYPDQSNARKDITSRNPVLDNRFRACGARRLQRQPAACASCRA